jgi:tetratricopeptide (TPR) repeat protein
MSGKTSKSKNTSSKTIATTVTTSSDVTNPTQRIIQNFLLIWVDAGIDQSDNDYQNILAQLRSVVNNVNIFTQPDECIQFLNGIHNEKAFVIASGALGQHLVPDIHAMPQLDAIYIFCHNKSWHEGWATEWAKVKGVHTAIKSICEALQMAAKQCNEDSIAVSFVTMHEGASSQNLDQLEPTFMYNQIYKEILREMEHNAQSIKDLASYCRNLYNNTPSELNIINEFEHDYRPKSSIWWYTRECFMYQMLNRALRILEVDTIINMGFFIRDLHLQIEKLHKKQVSNYRGKPFIVFRGQSLSTTDFEKLRKTKGGLMFFNNFLSASKTPDVSLEFAKGALGKTDTVGILFQMFIDPSVPSTAFASIKEVSFFKKEEEILFSMHAVFRIGDIKQIDKNNPLYQVELTLTSDDDVQLRMLTEHIRTEAGAGTGWQRIGQLLLKISQFDKAEELYTVLLEQTSDDGEKAFYYNQLGLVKNNQGDYEKAVGCYEKTREIYQKILPPNHPDLVTSYNNIGLIYMNMGEYSKALSFYEKALEIDQKNLPPNHPDLATSYNNIGLVYMDMEEYSKAISFYEKALEIYQKTLPPNHPSLATPYNNIGEVYRNMGEYSKALSFYEKDLEICQKTLPPNHPSLAISYNNIGAVYYNMENYSKALSYFERARDIWQRSLPPMHPQLQKVRENIEIVKSTI